MSKNALGASAWDSSVQGRQVVQLVSRDMAGSSGSRMCSKLDCATRMHGVQCVFIPKILEQTLHTVRLHRSRVGNLCCVKSIHDRCCWMPKRQTFLPSWTVGAESRTAVRRLGDSMEVWLAPKHSVVSFPTMRAIFANTAQQRERQLVLVRTLAFGSQVQTRRDLG